MKSENYSDDEEYEEFEEDDEEMHSGENENENEEGDFPEYEEFLGKMKKLKTTKEKNELYQAGELFTGKYEEEDENELSTEEVPDTLDIEPMYYEEEEITLKKEIEYHYRAALENLAKGNFSDFINDPIIQRDFPRIDDELRIYCEGYYKFIDFFPEYLDIWNNTLYWEENLNPEKVNLYKYIEEDDTEKKFIMKTISSECFENFQYLIHLVNTTKEMARKLEYYQKTRFVFSYDFEEEILEPIRKALMPVYRYFLA